MKNDDDRHREKGKGLRKAGNEGTPTVCEPVEKERGIARIARAKLEIEWRIAGRVAVLPLDGANGTILSGGLENGETRAPARTQGTASKKEKKGKRERRRKKERSERLVRRISRAIGSPRHSRSPTTADVWPGFVYIAAIEFSPRRERGREGEMCARESIR